MSKKNIVSIEDRIPKLKQARKKKANRRLIFYLSIFFFLISIIVYLQSPLSHIKTIDVNGNRYVTDEEIIENSNLTTDTNIWTINRSEIEQLIKKNPILESVKVSRKLPWTIDIQVKEQKIIGYIRNDTSYKPVMGNGKVLNVTNNTFNGEAPLIYGFDDDKYLHRMAEELKKLPGSIMNVISEIHWVPSEDNKNTVLLYMTDGYLVKGTIRDFAKKMEVYPSIVAQLDPEEKGIIHIGVGIYFESFNQEEDENMTEIEGIPDNEESTESE
ncbi:FtsQ-type POTRA domain-containing protein [Oceanobacillus sp. FSL K6-2867]|uniref:cell division protein FtsQ/DivIB n=1 Tax=Oceanobacillus sp. FSL K6-2867 TaxID=2954748 RepID=UPI0030DB263A